jgi:hypothetical protein
LDSSGGQIAANNDSGEGLNFQVSANLVAGEFYFLRVRNYSATTSSPANPYTVIAAAPPVSLSVSPSTTWSAAAGAPDAAAARAETVTFSGVGEWSASGSAEWLGVVPASGGDGATPVVVQAAPNYSFSARSGEVVFTAPGAAPVSVRVSQAAQRDDCGGSRTSYCAWTLPATGSVSRAAGLQAFDDEDWFRFTPARAGMWSFAAVSGLSGSGLGAVLMDSAGTPFAWGASDGDGVGIGYGLDAGKVYFLKVFNAEGNAVPAYAYTLSATAPGAGLSVSHSEWSAPAGSTGQSETFSMRVSMSGAASWSSSSSASWLTRSPTSSTQAFTSVTLTAAPNNSFQARTATVTFTASGASPVVVTVTQAGQVDECGQGLGAGCSQVLSATGPVSWSAGLQTGADEDWFEFTAPAGGTWVFESSGIPSLSNTYGYVLDAAGKQLAYNNDSGGGLNFKVSAKLTAGQVYHLRVRNYSATTTNPANPYTITATPPQ